MKNVKSGRPQSQFIPNTLLAKKLCLIAPTNNFNESAKFFGVKRDAAKKYLTGERVPDAISLASLRQAYSREHGGLLFDMNWLLDDSNTREEPLFSEIAPSIMNRVDELQASFVGLYNGSALYYTKRTRGPVRNLVPLVLGGDPEYTKSIRINQSIMPRLKGTDFIPEITADSFVPDDGVALQNRSLAPEIVENIPDWLLYIAFGVVGNGVLRGALGAIGKDLYESVKSRIRITGESDKTSIKNGMALAREEFPETPKPPPAIASGDEIASGKVALDEGTAGLLGLASTISLALQTLIIGASRGQVNGPQVLNLMERIVNVIDTDQVGQNLESPRKKTS